MYQAMRLQELARPKRRLRERQRWLRSHDLLLDASKLQPRHSPKADSRKEGHRTVQFCVRQPQWIRHMRLCK